jgi:hypothetical protein
MARARFNYTGEGRCSIEGSMGSFEEYSSPTDFRRFFRVRRDHSAKVVLRYGKAGGVISALAIGPRRSVGKIYSLLGRNGFTEVRTA